MDTQKTDMLLQFVLAVAGQADYPNKELRPIHLLKYVYLADLAFAARNNGDTFTGTSWKFHNFGPWSVEVFNRIEPATLAAGAEERRFPSRFKEDDVICWKIDDEQLLESLERQLPTSIIYPIRNAFKKYGADTYELLHYVYLTKPMLSAKPGDLLSFQDASPEPPHEAHNGEVQPVLSTRERKKRKGVLISLRERVQLKLEEGKKASGKMVVPGPPPVYDEIFFSGRQWLDSLGGPPLSPFAGEVSVSPDVWTSPARLDPDVAG